MRIKLVATLVSALALAGLGFGSASASASTLTLQNTEGESAEYADFLNSGKVYIAGAGGYWTCEKFNLLTEITKNESNPVTLASTEGNLSGCETPSGFYKFEYSEVETTGPMTLNANGTGTLPLHVNEYKKGLGHCLRNGTLNLTWYPSGTVYYEGVLKGDQSQGLCTSLETVWTGHFDPPLDNKGELIGWVVTP